jgi:RNA polymerase sigma-70 factor (ECF subfamily)
MINEQVLTEEFEKYRPQLRSFILRMTASIEDSKDIVQETYIKAFKNIQSFRSDSTLKTWLFSIATNLSKDFLRSKKLWPETVTDICREKALGSPEFLKQMMNIRQTSPHGNFEIREHIAFCFTCIEKSLPIEQQVVLLLKEVYEFKVQEIAEIMNITEGVVKHALHNSRQKMIEIFDRRCSLINKTGICHQCSELNGIFNPKHELQKELMKIEMARDAGTKNKEELFDLRTQIVKSIDPFDSAASELELHHLEHNRNVMEEYLVKN